ncbi:MAG: leucyl aminopeptidase [Acidobacteriota bacterium]
MQTYPPALPVSVEAVPPSTLDVDALVILVVGGVLPDGLDLDRATGGRLSRAIASKEFSTKPNALFVSPVIDAAWSPSRVMLAGVGPADALDLDRVRRATATAGRSAIERRWRRLAVVPPGSLATVEEVQAVAEGLTLSAFQPGVYKTDRDEASIPVEPIVCVPPDTGRYDLDACEQAASRGYVLGACCNDARALTNEPGNGLTPRAFAEYAARVAQQCGLQADVLDETRIAGLNMGLLLGVARGSAEPPRLVVVRYEPRDADSGPVLGLIGKGVTFDTGGLSLKSTEGMYRMKTDMSGGAAVLAAMKAIGSLKPPIRVVGVIPLTENMPGSRALRPGDVLRSAEGRTVEVLDTDAEGRLVLADALWYTRSLGATHLVDVATLTGACVVALGHQTSGLFGTPDWWVHLVRETATRSGDRVWPMPVWDEYREQLKSEIADIANIGGRPAGAVTAAVFLKEFTGRLPWAHLDIAGTAWSDETEPFQAKGPTGTAVRTLAQLAFTSDRWER